MQGNARIFVYACVGIFFIYGMFFSSIAGQSFGRHLRDIWRSPVVQEKLTIFAQSAHESYQENILPMAKKAHRTAIRTIHNAGAKSPQLSDVRQSAEQVSDLSHLSGTP